MVHEMEKQVQYCYAHAHVVFNQVIRLNLSQVLSFLLKACFHELKNATKNCGKI